MSQESAPDCFHLVSSRVWEIQVANYLPSYIFKLIFASEKLQAYSPRPP